MRVFAYEGGPQKAYSEGEDGKDKISGDKAVFLDRTPMFFPVSPKAFTVEK